MAYTSHYINPLIQFGQIEFDLIIEDDAGILPSFRITKTFPEDVSNDELDAEALKTIEKILLSEWTDHRKNPPVIPTNISSDIDLPDQLPEEIILTQ